MEEKRRGMRVMICAENREGNGYDESGRVYRRLDFHTVDLEKGKIRLKSLPSMTSYVAAGNLVSLGSFIYLFGADHDDVGGHDDDGCPVKGTARLQLAGRTRTWEAVPSPFFNPHLPCCVPLVGKIYNMGCPRLNPEVYDPVAATWKQLSPPSVPSPILDQRVSLPVLADPDNNRILVHMFFTNQLYAFYPTPPKEQDEDDGRWECLAENVSLWNNSQDDSPIVAVADNILYFVENHFFNPLLSAYDIVFAKRLQVVWSTTLVNGKDLTIRDYDAVLVPSASSKQKHKGILWLVSWSRMVDVDVDITITFVKIKAERDPTNLILTITPLDEHSFPLPNTCHIFKCLPF